MSRLTLLNMNCFNDLIQVRDLCGAELPDSSIYLDDVGVSLSDIESFITSNYSDAESYFNDRRNYAIREMQQTIYNYFQGQYRATSLIDSHRLGVYGNSTESVTGSDYRGIQLEFNQADSFMSVSIGEVSILCNFTGVIPIEVWDLRQNKLLQTVDLDATAGEISTVYLHKEFQSDKQPLNLFIGYDATGINSTRTPIKSGLCCGRYYCSNTYLTAQGVTVSGTFYDANTTTIDNTGGLSVVYDIKCDHISWICSHAASLALPLAYKVAEIMVADALYNTSGERATNHHTINIDQLKLRHEFYTGKFNDIMGGWLGNMQLPKNKCFQCDAPTRHKISLP